MIITICSSMRFLKEIAEAETQLKNMGFKVIVPKGLVLHRTKNWQVPKTAESRIKAKLKYDFIKAHFKEIEKADAILVLNNTKDGVKNYIGPNSFLEIGIAYYLNKKIYLLNPIPKTYLWEEVNAMQPIILKGDLSKMK